MTREIKFRIRLKHNDSNKEYFEYMAFEQVNNESRTGILYVDQYTGIKDKNEKEIYEGDIVLFPIFSNNISVELLKAIIIFREGCFMYHTEKDGDYCFPSRIDTEVIGNIYENPELLEEK